jgi:hypothetical protein
MKIGDLGRASHAWLLLVCATAALAAGALPSWAAVVISTGATKNMSCSAGVCTPTAKKAVLNVTDLANLLAAGDVKVVSDSAAVDIQFAAPLSWTSTGRLTLDSYRSLIFQQPVSVTGTGALTITTNDGGSGGDFWFEEKGHVEFWDLHSNLIVNGSGYALVRTINQLAKAVAKNPSGLYALAKSYNAAHDGTYSDSPVTTILSGTFEGLGNDVSSLSISNSVDRASVGLFTQANGTLRDVALSDATVSAAGANAVAGGLAGEAASISHSSVSGRVMATGAAGGLAGGVFRGVEYSHAAVNVSSDGAAGGLVAGSQGEINGSYATGAVSGGDSSAVGGLIGFDTPRAAAFNVNDYATGPVHGGNNAEVGGLIGGEGNDSFVSYSTGAVSGGSGSSVGGFYGAYASGCVCGNFDYWDVQTSGTDQGTGLGSAHVTGLTTKQFKSALPSGFDPTVWGQNKKINNGYPYLLANPPPK